MEKNNISYEKFMEIQTKLMERYGVSMEDIQSQYNLTDNDEYKKYRKQLGFMDKYKGKITDYSGFYYEIRNSVNDLSLFLNKTVVLITSKEKVDLSDNELNEFLVSYKKLQDDKTLQIRISESLREYDY
jgi:ABC-type glycerol-3-phosphate transport system substrate-binding protein